MVAVRPAQGAVCSWPVARQRQGHSLWLQAPVQGHSLVCPALGVVLLACGTADADEIQVQEVLRRRVLRANAAQCEWHCWASECQWCLCLNPSCVCGCTQSPPAECSLFPCSCCSASSAKHEFGAFLRPCDGGRSSRGTVHGERRGDGLGTNLPSPPASGPSVKMRSTCKTLFMICCAHMTLFPAGQGQCAHISLPHHLCRLEGGNKALYLGAHEEATTERSPGQAEKGQSHRKEEALGPTRECTDGEPEAGAPRMEPGLAPRNGIQPPPWRCHATAEAPEHRGRSTGV